MNLTDKLSELGVKVYSATVSEDYAVACLWDKLSENNEIMKLVTQSAYSLSGFLALLQAPSVTFYTQTETTLESLHWAEPVATSKNAVFFSSWWNADTRGTKHHAFVMSAIYELMCAMEKKTVMGVTKQRSLLDLHRKIGYRVLKPIPNLFDDKDAWIMYLTESLFKQGILYRVANHKKELMNAAA